MTPRNVNSYPDAASVDGMFWDNFNAPEISPVASVEFIGPGASEWSAPLSASAVRWSDVRRWRFALPQAPALNTQVGGGHYKSFKIQPVQYIEANGLDYLQGNVVKYVSRHKTKGGAEDVRKAIHYLQLILELQYAGGK